MKKIFLLLAIALMSITTANAETIFKVVTDSVAFMPDAVKIHSGVTSSGNPKWWIELPTESGVKKVALRETHVKSGRKLALIESKDETGKYTYSIKFAEGKTPSSGKANLSILK